MKTRIFRFSIVLIVVLLVGCSTITTIKLPEGDTVEVKSRNGSLVHVTRDKTKIVVDKRGRASFIEQLISMMFIKSDWIKKEVSNE